MVIISGCKFYFLNMNQKQFAVKLKSGMLPDTIMSGFKEKSRNCFIMTDFYIYNKGILIY